MDKSLAHAAEEMRRAEEAMLRSIRTASVSGFERARLATIFKERAQDYGDMIGGFGR